MHNIQGRIPDIKQRKYFRKLWRAMIAWIDTSHKRRRLLPLISESVKLIYRLTKHTLLMCCSLSFSWMKQIELRWFGRKPLLINVGKLQKVMRLFVVYFELLPWTSCQMENFGVIWRNTTNRPPPGITVFISSSEWATVISYNPVQ